MNLFEFMSNSPVLTGVIVFFIAVTIVETAQAFARAQQYKNKKGKKNAVTKKM